MALPSTEQLPNGESMARIGDVKVGGKHPDRRHPVDLMA